MPTREGVAKPVVVIIEDDPSISELLELYLSRESYLVHAVALGAAGVGLVRETNPALVVLDLMLPDGSGFDVLKTIRGFSQVPLIVLTARDAEQDKILGLELGADDYMIKPFSPGELVARARAVLRRAGPQGDPSAQGQVLESPDLRPLLPRSRGATARGVRSRVGARAGDLRGARRPGGAGSRGAFHGVPSDPSSRSQRGALEPGERQKPLEACATIRTAQ
jgi:DNA-binding response OmpR family regulator